MKNFQKVMVKGFGAGTFKCADGENRAIVQVTVHGDKRMMSVDRRHIAPVND